MTPDAIRSAAERYAAHTAATSGEQTVVAFSRSPYFVSRPAGSWTWDEYALRADQATLARAYLAAVPADDGEPVDRAFLEALGWVDVTLGIPRMQPKDNTFDLAIERHADGTWLISGERKLVANPTRGSVRRLLAALAGAGT